MGNVHIAQPQRQSLCRPTPTLKLAQRQLPHIKALLHQPFSKISFNRTHQNIAPDIDNIAPKLRRLQLTDRNPLIYCISRLNLHPRSSVKSLRKVKQITPAKWRKTKVQVIKPRVHQMQRSHLRMPRISNMPMAYLASPNPMRSPQMATICVEKRIPFTLK